MTLQLQHKIRVQKCWTDKKRRGRDTKMSRSCKIYQKFKTYIKIYYVQYT